MNTAESVIAALENRSIAFTSEQLAKIQTLARGRHDALNQQALHWGAKVTFVHNGQVVAGTVERMNRKTVTVRTAAGRWRVSPNLLTVQHAAEKPIAPSAPAQPRVSASLPMGGTW